MSKIALRDEIRASIQNDIMSGRLAPGERLDERLIARRHKVSRTPVREAINRLSINGLIEFRENRGAFVSTISVARVLQLCEVMSVLQTACARAAATRIDKEQLKQLRALAEEGSGLSERGDHDAYMKHNLDFHQAIGEASQNQFLLDETLRMRVFLAPFEREVFKSQRRTILSAQEHLAIVEAIADGQADKAGRLMEHHMDLLRDDHSGFLMMISRLAEGQRRETEQATTAADISEPRRSAREKSDPGRRRGRRPGASRSSAASA